MRTVGEIMTRKVVVADENMPFKDLVALLLEHHVSGVPVVASDGKLVGIVTEADLLIAGSSGTHHPSRFVGWFLSPQLLADLDERTRDLRVRDLMTREVVTVGSETLVREAVRILLNAGVKRLPVVNEGGRVVGIVSRRDLLAPYLRSDEEIRREIRQDVILRTMWIDPDEVHVAVHAGVAHLRGQVERKGVKDVLVELVRRVDGVVGVQDDLSYALGDHEVDAGPAWGAKLPGALRGV